MGGAAGAALQTGQRIGSSFGAALLITVYEVAEGPLDAGERPCVPRCSPRCWCSPRRWPWPTGRCAPGDDHDARRRRGARRSSGGDRPLNGSPGRGASAPRQGPVTIRALAYPRPVTTRRRPPSRYAGRWPASDAARRSTSTRPRSCSRRAARTCDALMAAAARVRDAGCSRPPAGPGSSPTPPRCSSRSPACAATAATTARSSPCPASSPPRGKAPYLSPDEVLAIAAAGARLGCTEALFTLGDRPEDRWPEARQWLDEARLRLDARLPAGDGGPGARGDRPAAAPQPRRHVLGGAQPAQAGRAVDGDDARDHVDPAVHREGPAALRLPRQGPRGAAAGARGRRPPVGPVHHRHPRRHRRDAARSGPSRSSRSAGWPAATGTCRR